MAYQLEARSRKVLLSRAYPGTAQDFYSPAACALFDLDEKNASGTDLKDATGDRCFFIRLQLVTSSACGGSTDFKRVGFLGMVNF